MHITHLITPARIIPQLHGTSVAQILQELAQHLATELPFSSAAEIAALWQERETINSTATGHGVAFPHARLPGLQAPLAILGRSQNGIDFVIPDQERVHLVMALLSPPEARNYHLKALGTVVRLLRSPTLRQRLQALHEPELLYHALITEEDES
ncbi:MAG: PTS sugar transporter subunit IIA [Magnetococcales bacterium]|nr:PTS sugar transporter subunit IIA [Magnetococcales bacterium]MBF0113518.1 PTS sugar transporter subunit IIA [Magnetococcales bacterium]